MSVRTVHLAGVVAVLVPAIAPFPVAASAQETTPTPPTHQAPDGSATLVNVQVRVTKHGIVRLAVRCPGVTPCTGSVRLQTKAPVSPGNGKPRRVVTIVEGSYGVIPAGRQRTVRLPLAREARARMRAFRSTEARYAFFYAGGLQQHLFLPDRATVTSDLYRPTEGVSSR